MRLGLFSLCLPVVQNLTLCPPEVPSVRDLLPTSFFAVKKNTFLGKNKHNKDKKVRVFYCLRISMRTKHKSTVLLFSCPISYSNMYWFEFAVSLPKKQSPFYQRLPNISQNCQTKLNTYTHTLSLSLSFGSAAMASLSAAISHSSSHVALAHNTKPKKIHQS